MENWYVLKTKTNSEFAVCDQLRARHIESYLPLWQPVDKDNSKKLRRPFFPSYLFTRVDLSVTGLSSLIYLPGVHYLLMCDDKPVRVEQRVIDEIMTRMEYFSKSVADAGGKPLFHGDKVRISGGVFDGFPGVFDKRLAAGDRVRVLIDFLQKQTPLELDRNMVRKIGSA